MQTVAHYEIVRELGEGGMGTVYQARDTHLDRFVALKIIRADLVANESRRNRFVREAKAASALNHPNVVHIYDIGNADGVEYIAMEYIDGTTLGKSIQDKPLPLQHALKYAIAIADALAAAHAEGIVHRDLKPDNVMINERGTVKILDFGLAKLLESPERVTTSDAPGATRTLALTSETQQGVAMGTPAYMAPEQAEGREIDARADMFSFGVLLYEMATGVRPFKGDSAASLLASILRDEPRPMTELADVPDELERIAHRCLRKRPDQRYLSMAEVRDELEQVRDATRSPSTLGSGLRVSQPLRVPAERAVDSRSPVGARIVLARALRRASAAAGVLALLAAGAGLWWFLRRPAALPSAVPVLVRITSEGGLDTTPAISLDGKWLAYASDRSGEDNLDIWLRQINGSGEPIRLTNDPANDSEPSFSPDGTRIAFHSERKTPGPGIYVIPTLGGEAHLIAPQGRRPLFSPDGSKIAYWAGPEGKSATRTGWGKVFIVDSNGGQPVQLQPGFDAAIFPVWTPDGKNVLMVGSKTMSPLKGSSWWVAPIDGGEAIDTGFQASRPGGRYDDLQLIPVAIRNGRVIYSHTEGEISNVREVEFSHRTWRITGAPHRLTFGTTREDFPSVAGGGQMVFASVAANLDIYSLPMDTDKAKVTGELRRLTKNSAYDSVRDISADGKRLVFLSNRTERGHVQVWGKDLETGTEKQLTHGDTSKRQPVITPDGQWVAYAEDGTGANTIYLVSFMGGPAKIVCDQCGTQSGWSPDGKQLVFTNYSKPRNPTWCLDVDSGQKREVLSHSKYSLFPRSASPDGKWVSFSADRGPAGPVLSIAPFRPGNPPPESEWINLTDASAYNSYPRWSPDGDTIYFTSDRLGAMGVFAQRLEHRSKQPVGSPSLVELFGKPSLPMSEIASWISVARDKIVFSLEERAGNIWMLAGAN